MLKKVKVFSNAVLLFSIALLAIESLVMMFQMFEGGAYYWTVGQIVILVGGLEFAMADTGKLQKERLLECLLLGTAITGAIITIMIMELLVVVISLEIFLYTVFLHKLVVYMKNH